MQTPRTAIDSAAAWARLGLATVLSTIGGVGMWSVVVVLPAVQAEFGVARGEASLPYTLTMIGFAFGGVLMGRLADRFGVMLPLSVGAGALTAGYVAAAYAPSLWTFAIAQGLLIGMLGSSASFAPLMADISHWFLRRRGIAVAICASGNYLAGALWPPVVQHFVASHGWRTTYICIGVFCALAMPPLAVALRRRPPHEPLSAGGNPAGKGLNPARLDFPPGVLLSLLVGHLLLDLAF
jgi:MFS family permease